MSERKFKVGDRVKYLSKGDICTVIDSCDEQERWLLKSDSWAGTGKTVHKGTLYDEKHGYFFLEYDRPERWAKLAFRKVKATPLARKMYTKIDKEEDGFIWVK